jgi:hypothetical protein
MATNLDIIKGAMKKLHVLAAGTDPNSVQAADGMDALQGLLVELIGQGSLGRLHDVLVTADYTAREFDRIRCDNVTLVTEFGELITTESGDPLALNTITITLPTTITPGMYSNCDYGWWQNYGFLRCSKPRPPFDRAPVVVINQAGVQFTNMYNAYSGKWVLLNNLKLTDTFPLADYFVEGFKALLAERMADDFSTVAGPSVQQAARTCRWMLAAKPDSASRPVRAEYM